MPGVINWSEIGRIGEAIANTSISAGGLLVPEDIIHPEVSASELTWLIRYIYYRNVQYLNNVIIDQTNRVVLPQA